MAIKKTPKKTDKILPPETTEKEIDQVIEKLEEDLPEIEILEEPVQPSLTQDELHRLQLSQFQVRAYDAEMRLEMIAKDLFLQQIDPQGKLNQFINTIRNKNADLVVAKKAYEDVTKEIETRLGINLKDYAYDDLTGTLNKVE